jgi:hypothetical protein
MTSGKLASKGCPANEVVYQVFPVESQPLTECKHYATVAQFTPSSEDDEVLAMPESFSNMPDPNFFRGDYSNSANNANQGNNVSPNHVPGVVDRPAPQTGWISRDSEPNQNILKKWGADQAIPRDAFLDDDMADAPAVESNDYKPREPGVLIQPPPKIDFREDYN